jgi:S-formylglutathione hydrolase FrmB
MALVRCEFYSDVLELSTSMTVVLPQATSTQIGMEGSAPPGDPPVLYLLHGLSDDDTIWSRRTSIERYAAPLGLAVVMPRAHRSFYADEAHGGRFWTVLSEELPRVVAGFFRVSDRREDTFVAGLSMGGYGAMKWALREPGRFAAAASLSGALDLAGLQDRGDRAELFARVFDRQVAGTDDDLLTLLRRRGGDGADLPALHLSCGREDPVYDDNTRFVAVAEAAGVAVTTQFGPGEHEWALWDRTIQDVLAWLPLDAGAGRGTPAG